MKVQADCPEVLPLDTGMKTIAKFYNLPTAKAGRLARKNLLPGVFALGRCYFLDKQAALEAIREKSTRKTGMGPA